jgi:hypothetical protein
MIKPCYGMRPLSGATQIDREALLHDIEQSVVYTARGKITSAEMRGAHKIIERIKCAPAVEPIYIHEPTKSEFKRMAAQLGYEQVVHGRWECVYDDSTGETDVTCSHCKNTRTVNGCFVSTDGKSCYFEDDYCPNCGAKMDGAE